jgi:DNA-binding CsgD family transcriptional regulator
MRKRGRPPYPDVLTPREWEVLALLRQGLTNEQIADRLSITIHAARYHVSEILSKLGVSSRQEAAAWEPEKAKPVWMSALTLALWPVKHMPFGVAAKASAAVVLVGAAGAIGFLVWGLVVTSGEPSPCDLNDAEPAQQAAELRGPTPFPTAGEVEVGPDGRYMISGRADGCNYCEDERSPTGDERLWVLMRSRECQPVGLVIPGDAGALDVMAIPTVGPPSPDYTPSVATPTPIVRPAVCPEPYRKETPPEEAQPPSTGVTVRGGEPSEGWGSNLSLPAGREFIVWGGISDPGGGFIGIYDTATRSRLFLSDDGCEDGRWITDPAADAVFDAIVANNRMGLPATATPEPAAAISTAEPETPLPPATASSYPTVEPAATAEPPVTPTPTPEPGVCPTPVRQTPTDFAEPPPIRPAEELPGQMVEGGGPFEVENVTLHLPEGRDFVILSGPPYAAPGELSISVYDVETASQLVIRVDGCETYRFVRDPAADAVFDAIVATIEVGSP